MMTLVGHTWRQLIDSTRQATAPQCPSCSAIIANGSCLTNQVSIVVSLALTIFKGCKVYVIDPKVD